MMMNANQRFVQEDCMDRQKQIETSLIPLVLTIAGVRRICGSLLLAAVLGIGLYAAAVWIDQKFLID